MPDIFTLAPGGVTAINVDDVGNLTLGGTSLLVTGAAAYINAGVVGADSLYIGGGTPQDVPATFLDATGTEAGALKVRKYKSAATAVSTSGAATTLSAVIPAGSTILGYSIKVTTTIAGINSSTGTLTVTGGGSGTLGTIAAFTAGTTGTGGAAIAVGATAANLVFTLSGGADNTPSAGAIQVLVWYVHIEGL